MADEKKYQVFISSTFIDLQEERRALQDLLLSKKYVPVGMETFLGSHKALPQYLKDLIDACDYYVVIVAGRYGSKNSAGVSWTELEYDYAASTDIPILAFFKSSDQDYTDEIKNFMNKISMGCTPTYWKDKGELAGKVFRQLTETETPRPGWARADTFPQRSGSLQKERDDLQAQLNALQSQYKALESKYASSNKTHSAEKQALEKHITELKATITEKNTAIAGLEARIDNLSRRSSPAPALPKISKFIDGEWTNLYRGFGGLDWLVLDVDKQNNRALLLSKDIIEQREYNDDNKSIDWENCTLRKYLNGAEFSKRFRSDEWARVYKPEKPGTENEDNQWFETKGGEKTRDSVFLLSISEAVKYFGDSGQLKNKNPKSEYRIDDQYNDRRAAKSNSVTAWWWFRSPGFDQSYAAFVYSGGNARLYGFYVNNETGGVRPALWLNL